MHKLGSIRIIDDICIHSFGFIAHTYVYMQYRHRMICGKTIFFLISSPVIIFSSKDFSHKIFPLSSQLLNFFKITLVRLMFE